MKVITLDGPTASGKSTIAERLAQQLGYLYINSGLLFRALAYLLDKQGIKPTDPQVADQLSALTYSYTPEEGAQIAYNGERITSLLKTPKIDQLASEIAVQPRVRDLLLTLQQTLAQGHNVVADGRDSGTVVFPDAEHKFYITASLDIRARRWKNDQERKGKSFSFEESKKIVDQRDQRDAQRAVAPLTIPEQATILDTSDLSIDQSVAACLEVIAP